MTATPVTWTIREQRDGPITVWKGRQRVMSVDDGRQVSEIAPLVRRQMSSVDVLVHQEPDGYRNRLQGRRRGWRAGLR